MTAIAFPIIHPRNNVVVRVDPETLDGWAESGRSLKWFYDASGPYFNGSDGTAHQVIDVIMGGPAIFADGDIFNLTKSNLRPAPRCRRKTLAPPKVVAMTTNGGARYSVEVQNTQFDQCNKPQKSAIYGAG